MELAYDQWNHEQSGLTPAGAALVAIAVACATGGAALTSLTQGTAFATSSGRTPQWCDQTGIATPAMIGDWVSIFPGDSK